MKTLLGLFALSLILQITTVEAKPAPLVVDTSVNPSEKPYSTCYQKAKNLRINRKELLSTAQLVTVFKKAPNYPESERSKKTSACVFLLYNILADGKADNVRLMEASPRTKAFIDDAIQTLMDLEFAKKPTEDQALIFTYQAN